MDIVLSVKGGRRSEEVLSACLSGLKNIEHDQVFVIGQILIGNTVPVTTTATTEWGKLCYVSTLSTLSDEFIYMDDHTIVTAPYTPEIGSNIGFLPRGKEGQRNMVNTLRYLLDKDLSTFDYETDLPVVLNKQRILSINIPDDHYAVRTLYFNSFIFEPPKRLKSAHIDIWSHWDDPRETVVHLSDTALEHKQCRKWLEKTIGKGEGEGVPEEVL